MPSKCKYFNKHISCDMHHINHLQGMAFLLVVVIDVDTGSLDDTVDAIIVHILPSSLGNYSQVVGYVGEFGYGTLTARYRVDCDENFYGEGSYIAPF